MSCYKGRPKTIEKDFPHIVETIVPLGAFGKRLNDLYDFHAHNSIRARLGLGWRDEHGREVSRWCFAHPTIAFNFRKCIPRNVRTAPWLGGQRKGPADGEIKLALTTTLLGRQAARAWS